MTTGRNRLEPVGCESTKRFLDPPPDSLFPERKSIAGPEDFITDFRPVLKSFLHEANSSNADANLAVEDLIDRFRRSRSIRSWRRTVLYRQLIQNLLLETLSGDSWAVDRVDTLSKQLDILWRNHVLGKSWQLLQTMEIDSGRPYFSVLKRRYEKPWLPNDNLLRELSDIFQSDPSKQAFRIFVHRCEKHLARGVVSAVTRTIHLPNSNAVRREMNALDLVHFVTA